MWLDNTETAVSDDDEPVEDDDPICPTILLTAAEKRMLREPWRNALIIRMFDKGIGYLQLKRRLKTKWALRGDFSLIDIGRDYYVTRFTNMEDYEHVMLNGPWMIGDNYVVIREWVPNFIPEEDNITKLIAWVRIPKLSVEYFNKTFLLQKIGQKIGKVLKVDSTTANVERGQYIRLCVEVDLTKPLLSKFRLNGRIWGVQYEGLKMICFKCGRQGHKEEGCPLNHAVNTAEESDTILPNQNQFQSQDVQKERDYGAWMLVKKPARRTTIRNQGPGSRGRGPDQREPNPNRLTAGPNRSELNLDKETEQNRGVIIPQVEDRPLQGSRFLALSEQEQDMDLKGNALDNSIAQETTNGEKETNPLMECNLVNLPQGMRSQNRKGDQSGPENVATAQHTIPQAIPSEEAILAHIDNLSTTQRANRPISTRLPRTHPSPEGEVPPEAPSSSRGPSTGLGMAVAERNILRRPGGNDNGTPINPQDGRGSPSIVCGRDNPPSPSNAPYNQAGLRSPNTAQVSRTMFQRQGKENGPGEVPRGQHRNL